MTLLAALQTDTAGWVPPTIAVSMLLLAAVSVTVLIALLLALKKVGDSAEKLEHVLGEMHGEIRPALKNVQDAAGAARDIAAKVEGEVHAAIQTSQRIRHGVERGFRRARRRAADLDALAEVVQDELEQTALDVTATLRTVRKGKGVVGRIRRMVRGGR